MEEELDNDDIYRNVVGSKDGNLIAVLFTNEEDKIHVYDFVKEEWKSLSYIILPIQIVLQVM